jgi:uncharacterized cofD-like protein
MNGGGRVVALGGGTGLPALLESIKPTRDGSPQPSEVTAIVTVTDDGGSSGRLRRDLGTLPPGDIRRCLVALSDAPDTLRDLFQYRFGAGELEGHSLGNLLIAALADISGDFASAIRKLHDILNIRGKIFPSTLDSVALVASMEDGSEVRGEGAIAAARKGIRRVRLEPGQCRALPEACEALQRADLILLGPGSLFTSVIPNLLVRELAEAVRASRARKVYVCNLVTQPGESDGYTVSRHLAAVLDHGGEGIVDTVLCNAAPLPGELAEAYRAEGAERVSVDALDVARLGPCLVQEDLLLEGAPQARHDPGKLRDALLRLLRSATA